MSNIFPILIGKSFSFISRLLGRGAGSTWPGHIALSLNKNFVKNILQSSRTKVIYIAGTNGKTTTSKLIQTILEKNGHSVLHNSTGANLLNGLASVLIKHSSVNGNLHYDYAVFEIDENTLPLAVQAYPPDYLLLLNLFRDQLDRYGEVNIVADKWSKVINKLNNTTVILNADDPQTAYFGLSLRHSEHNEESRPHVLYFGLNDKSLAQKNTEHAADSLYCPKCGNKLTYSVMYYSHIGEWKCDKCKLERPYPDVDSSPFYPLEGMYSKYNVLAALAVAKANNISEDVIEKALRQFQPAFGRQEIIEIDSKKVQIFLSKNPASFNESLRTIHELKAKNVLFVLNDRIPDGTDVSWIWDIDVEKHITKDMNISVSGDRTYDMALRIKYADFNPLEEIELDKALKKSLAQTVTNETLYILPTYSAMLDVRKILTGRKIQ